MSAAVDNRPRMPARTAGAPRLFTVHIVVSVGVLGESAGFLVVAIRTANSDHPQLAAANYQVREMFSLVFGIPLSFVALLSDITLGISSTRGVLRHFWTTSKLALIASVVLPSASSSTARSTTRSTAAATPTPR